MIAVTKPSSVKHLPTDDTIRLICRYVPSSSGNGEWEVLSPMLVSKSGLTETSISSLLRRCRIRRHHIHRTGYQFRLQYSGIYLLFGCWIYREIPGLNCMPYWFSSRTPGLMQQLRLYVCLRRMDLQQLGRRWWCLQRRDRTLCSYLQLVGLR